MVELELSRRQLLAGIGLGAGYYLLGDRGEGTVGGGTTLTDASPRDSTVRPLAGGTWITTEETEGYGSLGTGVQYDGTDAVVTNRHVVDTGSSEDPSDVEGRAVYQPAPSQSELIGPVEEASTIGGSGSSDWAVISVSESSDYGTETFGLGNLSDRDPSPAVDDRIVLDGARTGLIGGTVTGRDVSANFRGELYSGMLEYTVDDNAETSGNSGCLVVAIDASDGTFAPIGLHTFSIDNLNYAIPWTQLPSSVSIDTTAISPDAPDTGAWTEGVVYARDSNGIHIRVSNLGGSSSSPTVQLLDPGDGSEIVSTSVSLNPIERTNVLLTASGYDKFTLSVGQTERTVELAEP